MRVWDWSETSQTVTLYTRAHGLVRCIAKGSKRPATSGGWGGAAFSGGLEMLTRGECTLYIKPSADLATLARWDLIETYPAIRRSLAAHHAGLFVGEILLRFSADRDPHPELFDALTEALRALSDAPVRAAALARFLLAVLNTAGYRPVLDRLLPEGSPPLPTTSVYAFDPERGGLIASGTTAAALGASNTGPKGPWLVRRETLTALAEIESGAGLDTIDAKASLRGARLLAHHARHVLGIDLATMDLVFSDAPAQPDRAG